MKNYNSKFKTDIGKRTYVYALKIIKALDQLSRNDLSCQVIGRQLLRSATRIGANIVEAQAASSKKDFTNLLNHSLKSASESKFWLSLLRDSEKVSKELINPLLAQTKELANILASSVLKLKGKK